MTISPRLFAERLERQKLFKQRRILRFQLQKTLIKEERKAIAQALQGIGQAIKNTLT